MKSLFFFGGGFGGGGGVVAFLYEERGSGEEHRSSALSILWEHFDRQSSVLKGNLLLAGSEEAVYRGACLI